MTHVSLDSSALPAATASGLLAAATITQPQDPARQQLMRDEYLKRVAKGEGPLVVLIQGQSASGKNTLLTFLESSGVEAAKRLLPREWRSGDSAADVPWNGGAHGERSGSYQPEEICFAQFLYKGYYGFPAVDLIQLMAEGKKPGVIIGRSHEIPPIVQAVRDLVPLTTVLPLYVEVPLSIIGDRLSNRREAHTGERGERLAALESHNALDRRQRLALVGIYGERAVINVTDGEARKLGMHSEQLKPITTDFAVKLISEFAIEARQRSADLAADILHERRLSYSHPFVPDALIDVLDHVLLPACQRHNVDPVILGGLAVGLYLGESRPVSLDIDFIAPQRPDLEERMVALISEITGEPCVAQDAWEKKVYHVRGLHGVVKSVGYGDDCELDALISTRIQPNDKGFCYEFPFDQSDFFLRRSVSLPSGEKVYLMPPEHIVIGKLTAGRGPELGKYDLFDAAGLMAKMSMDPSVIRKLLDCHVYDKDLDKDIRNLIHGLGEAPSTDELCGALGIQDRGIRDVLQKEFEASPNPFEAPLGPTHTRFLVIDVLKKAALIDRLSASLDGITENLDHPWDVGNGDFATIAVRFGRSEVQDAISKLRTQLHYYAEFELGRRDVYAKRHGMPAAPFFVLLDEQMRRLDASQE
jgi:hypothetical protein